MNQKQFCEQVRLSLSRISNIEHGRVAVTTDVVNEYIGVLRCDGKEADDLMKLADFSNTSRKFSEDGAAHPPLLALFKQFGERISPRAAAEIQKILERETGEQISSLAFSSNKGKKRTGRSARGIVRPSMMPRQFVQICLQAQDVRQNICSDMQKLDIGLALEKISDTDEVFEYDVVEILPAFAEGAFACIVGQRSGHLIIVERKRFLSAINGVHFARHVIAHEIAHHFRHPELLKSDGEIYLPSQSLAQNTPDLVGTERQIEQVVDSMVEVEAECFATMFLVPWEAFLKGTSVSYLCDDYGEQLGEIKRYAPMFKNPAVIDAFKATLWEKGFRKHTIFSMN